MTPGGSFRPRGAAAHLAGGGQRDPVCPPLRQVELPLALPAILAGLRIAATTTVGLATLAFFAGAGGLGAQIYADINFKSNIVVAGGLCIVLAVVLDLGLLATERVALPWRRAG